jgi:hypothetical protein
LQAATRATSRSPPSRALGARSRSSRGDDHGAPHAISNGRAFGDDHPPRHNEPTASIALSGTGGAANSRPTGPQGPQGPPVRTGHTSPAVTVRQLLPPSGG